MKTSKRQQNNTLKIDEDSIFSKGFKELTRSRDYSTVFNDFLDFGIYCLSVGKYTDDFKRLKKQYNEEELCILKNMFVAIGEASEDFTDSLGDIFMNYVSFGRNGQFFTPDPICDLMSEITMGEIINNSSVCDPACGSGRMLLSAAKRAREAKANIFCYGSDTDLTCVKMATINMFINSVPGEIAWGNSLSLEHWRSYEISLLKYGNAFFPSLKFLEPEESTFFLKLENTVNPEKKPAEIILPSKEKRNNSQNPEQLSLF